MGGRWGGGSGGGGGGRDGVDVGGVNMGRGMWVGVGSGGQGQQSIQIPFWLREATRRMSVYTFPPMVGKWSIDTLTSSADRP